MASFNCLIRWIDCFNCLGGLCWSPFLYNNINDQTTAPINLRVRSFLKVKGVILYIKMIYKTSSISML